MPDTPTIDERACFIEQLGARIAAAGSARFVAGPIVEPDGHYFPDKVRPDSAGVTTIARRLLWWAGLSDLKVEVADMTSDRESRKRWSVQLSEFDGEALLLTLESVGPLDELAGALTHPLALAASQTSELDTALTNPYRREPHSETSESSRRLAALATIELGWGVLATNAAQCVRTVSVPVTTGQVDVLYHRYGALRPEDLAYLLAVQLAVREVAHARANAYAKLLHPNQAQMFREWFAALASDAASLRQALHLPDREHWPKPAALQPVTPFRDKHPKLSKRQSPERRRNWERPVFRVRASNYGLILGGLMAGGVGAAVAPHYALLWVASGTLLGGVAHLVVSSSPDRRYVCSDPKCSSEIPDEALRCSYCGGIVAGTISSPKERLRAEAALPPSWWREHGLKPPSEPPSDA